MNIEKALEKVNDTIDWEHVSLKSVAQRNDLDDTPLHVAAAVWGDIEMMQLFIEYGADINALGEDDDTPLHSAVIGGNYDAVKHLLENGAKQIKNNLGQLPIDIVKTKKSIIFKLLVSYAR